MFTHHAWIMPRRIIDGVTCSLLITMRVGQNNPEIWIHVQAVGQLWIPSGWRIFAMPQMIRDGWWFEYEALDLFNLRYQTVT
jgi:hypothetical protein